MRWSKHKSVVGSLEGCDVVTVIVGEEEREFTIHRQLLFDSCPFFRTYLNEIPSSPRPRDGSNSNSNSSSSGSGSGSDSDDDDDDDDEDSALLLPSEAPDMFELFVLWLYQRRRFPYILDNAVQTMNPDKARLLRNDLVRLHLFAAMVDLPALQDAAMDALQDMYLRFDWDVSPRFLAFLYGDCDAQHSMRLRRWAVAMLAWALNGPEKFATTTTTTTTTTTGGAGATGSSSPGNASSPTRASFDRLFAMYPELQADYHQHLHKMAMSRADVRVKNPQLRLPANKLMSGERFFGFRQCTFHSHRASVGEGACPHTLAAPPPSHPLPPLPQMPMGMGGMGNGVLAGGVAKAAAAAAPQMQSSHAMMGKTQRVARDKEDVESDQDEDQLLIFPVGDLNEISYLDLS